VTEHIADTGGGSFRRSTLVVVDTQGGVWGIFPSIRSGERWARAHFGTDEGWSVEPVRHPDACSDKGSGGES
jgi:hypothetical protein